MKKILNFLTLVFLGLVFGGLLAMAFLDIPLIEFLKHGFAVFY